MSPGPKNTTGQNTGLRVGFLSLQAVWPRLAALSKGKARREYRKKLTHCLRGGLYFCFFVISHLCPRNLNARLKDLDFMGQLTSSEVLDIIRIDL